MEITEAMACTARHGLSAFAVHQLPATGVVPACVKSWERRLERRLFMLWPGECPYLTPYRGPTRRSDRLIPMKDGFTGWVSRRDPEAVLRNLMSCFLVYRLVLVM